jgi:flagellar assembly factor FliW
MKEVIDEEVNSEIKGEESLIGTNPVIFFEIVIVKKQSQQFKKYKYPQTSPKGSMVPRFLMVINYKKEEFDIAVIEPKIVKDEYEIRVHEYDNTKI